MGAWQQTKRRNTFRRIHCHHRSQHRHEGEERHFSRSHSCRISFLLQNADTTRAGTRPKRLASHADTMLLLHQCVIYTHFVRVSMEKCVYPVSGVRRKCTMSLNPT